MSRRTRSNAMTKPSENFYDVPNDHPLCLCEYFNKHGQRAHILMCCCNCEAFDTFCTSLCCGESDSIATQSRSRWRLFSEFLDDLSDRLRVPCPGGARTVDIDFILSLISLLFYVILGTMGFIFSLAVVLFVPFLVYIRFFTARLSSKSSSTRIAFYMLFNIFLMCFILFNVSLANEISQVMSTFEWHLVNFYLITGLVGLIYLKYSNPGFINPYTRHLAPSTVSSEEKCSKCSVKRDPFQSGHCPICGSCVYRRDHHCFWVDNCIGYLNHKAFVLYLVQLLALAIYSFVLIMRHLRSLPCKLSTIWYTNYEPIPDIQSFSCLFDVFYSNFARAFLTLLFIQLVPLIGYLLMLVIQQACFISLGLTQNQLFKLSQANIRFSLALYIGSNFKITTALNNWYAFLTRIRRLSDFSYNDHLV